MSGDCYRLPKMGVHAAKVDAALGLFAFTAIAMK
jgi:hypothetical protein